MRTPISCGRTSFKLDGEDQTSADIVDEFADDHEVWAHAFLEGWQVNPRSYLELAIKWNLWYCRPFKRMGTTMAVLRMGPSPLGWATLFFLKVFLIHPQIDI